jgi:MFS superfamily sulfate permease-like transporter
LALPRHTQARAKTHSFKLFEYWQQDLVAGFLVFLIALPLCLGISLASGYPAIAGIFSAVIGGILSAFISNSELTIKGPAAGLIVIALDAVIEFGFTGGHNPTADLHAYRQALGVGVAAGILQMGFGVMRLGILAEFFPKAAVHGLLAAIGIIIMAKQLPIVLGVNAAGSPLEILARIPDMIVTMHPVIGLIGLASLFILFRYPRIKNQWIRKIPAPLIVLLLAIPTGILLDLGHPHTFTFNNNEYLFGPNFLVNVPENLFAAITFPDFSGLTTVAGWKYVLLFAVIGSLESLLSAKAIDAIDPWRRKTAMDRDLFAVGIGNTLTACIGGFPMISEIVRSKANIDNGAHTRLANMAHGFCLLLFVALAPVLINHIPLAALGAMLVVTGFRLASPKEFRHVYHVGKEQLLIFLATLIGVLATDLLIGILIGIGVKLLIHFVNGAPLLNLFVLHLSDHEGPDTSHTVAPRGAAVFGNWIRIKKRIQHLANDREIVVVDLSGTHVVDHTVMEKLHELQQELQERNCRLVIKGLENHQALSDHPHAAQKRRTRPLPEPLP